MAKKEDRKKQKKRLKEQKKTAKRDKVISARASEALYPRIIIQPSGGDPAFVSIVQELADTFDFNDSACCTDEDREVFKMYRQEGTTAMLRRAETLAKEAPQAGFKADQAKWMIHKPLLFLVGEWIFARLSEEYRENPLPLYYFKIVPYKRDLYVLFDFLPQVPSEHGTVYYPQARPSVSIGGGQWKVAFFKHAIERICERICPDEKIGYRNFTLCQIYFKTCVHYEPCELPNGDHGIRLFHKEPPVWRGEANPLIKGILGLDRHPGQSTRLYRVLGYCPVAFVGARAVAITFLCPGFRNTPEHALVESADMPTELRQRLRALGANNMAKQVYSEEGIEALKWYHDNGIPQVLELSQKVFSSE